MPRKQLRKQLVIFIVIFLLVNFSSVYHEERDFINSVNSIHWQLFNLNPRGLSKAKDQRQQSFRDEQEKRLRHLHEACEEINSDPKLKERMDFNVQMDKPLYFFAYMPQYKLFWCRCPKVGTSTWSRLFLEMYGHKPKHGNNCSLE